MGNEGESVIEKTEEAYLRVQVVDLLNGGLDIPSVYRVSDFYSFVYRLRIDSWLYVRFGSEFLRGRRIAFADQIIHYQVVDVSVGAIFSIIEACGLPARMQGS